MGISSPIFGMENTQKEKWVATTRWFPKMVGFPNKPMGFPTKNDHDLGREMGVCTTI